MNHDRGIALQQLLLSCTPIRVSGDVRDVRVLDICIDSRKVTPGALFVCLPGAKMDGHAFVAQAQEKGAVALVVQHEVESSLPQIVLADSRLALSQLCAAFYGNPAKRLNIIGVTGTNGKTTTTYLLKSIFEQAGETVGLMGTIATLIGREKLPQSLTTPDPMDLHHTLRLMADAGCTRVVMEVSAHALALKKMDGIQFDVGIFTNFTQDHLDDFVTMDRYFAAKQLLFDSDVSKRAVVNADDEAGERIVRGYRNPVLYYGLLSGADLRADDIALRMDGSDFTLHYKDQSRGVRLRISGHFNVLNALAAIGAALQCGVDLDTAVRGVQAVERMDGRMERVDAGQDFTVIVDYAHSPDSLENVLKAARRLTDKRVIAVFGCGGDRDRTKRPIMGRIAAQLADYAIITSDNPRTEVPDSIIDMIEPGAREGAAPFERITDRRAAIGRALSLAQNGDIVLIAGKGHETYQDVMGVKHHFDDREIAREFLAKR